MQVFSSRIRIADFMKRTGTFPSRFFSDAEREIFKLPVNAGSLAARLLLKELLKEHYGLEADYPQIEILNNGDGKPMVRFPGSDALENAGNIHISLSHAREYAAAMLVVEN